MQRLLFYFNFNMKGLFMAKENLIYSIKDFEEDNYKFGNPIIILKPFEYYRLVKTFVTRYDSLSSDEILIYFVMLSRCLYFRSVKGITVAPLLYANVLFYLASQGRDASCSVLNEAEKWVLNFISQNEFSGAKVKVEFYDFSFLKHNNILQVLGKKNGYSIVKVTQLGPDF